MSREKAVYRWYLVLSIVESFLVILVMGFYLFINQDDYYLVISFWSTIASFWLYFNTIIFVLIIFDKINEFSPLLPALYIIGEVFSGFIVSLLSIIAIVVGTEPLSLASGELATGLDMIFPIATLIIATKLYLKIK